MTNSVSGWLRFEGQEPMVEVNRNGSSVTVSWIKTQVTTRHWVGLKPCFIARFDFDYVAFGF